jgi:sugar lactone lactonase YvrE
MTCEVELVVNLKSSIGEGPVWDADSGTIYWVDLLGNVIHALDCASGKVSSMDVGQNTGCVALREKGGLVAALQHGFYFVDMADRSMLKIGDPDAHRPENRFNDGKCDCAGRLWAGTMSKKLDSGYGDSGPEGSVYCLEPDRSISRKIELVTISNGLGWSPDNRVFYYIDSPTKTVVAYDFDPERGSISGKRVVVSLPEGFVGMPDGMCVDSEGMLWIALWGGSAVVRWDPKTGKMLERLAVPALNVSSCTFGGEALDELIITTARLGTDTAAYPEAGGVFKAKPGVKGLPTCRYGG